MTEWKRIEEEATQRLVGALVGKYGAALSEVTEEQAAVLATVALAGIRAAYLDEARIAAILQELGESVEIYYEPRNEGQEWYVGFADPHGSELPVHEHFESLLGGLLWLSRNGVYLRDQRGQVLRTKTGRVLSEAEIEALAAEAEAGFDVSKLRPRATRTRASEPPPARDQRDAADAPEPDAT
jgi:hypothetical protein